MSWKTSRSPSSQWRRQHGTKIEHRSREGAVSHCEGLNERFPDAGLWQPYECRWAQDYREGETALPHWHVGRKATKWVER